MSPRVLTWTGWTMFASGIVLTIARDTGMALIAFVFAAVLFWKVTFP